jgi:3-oxoacyl-[acyl-carrier protein] reductase
MSAARNVLVTGAAQGIGAAIADLFARAGYGVVALDANAERLQQTCASMTATATAPTAVVADLADPGALGDVWAKITAHRSIDILINNAAVTHLKPLWDITVSEWDDVVAVNQRAVFLLSRLAGAAMRAR